MPTVAEFLREKATNMVRWLQEKGYDGPVDFAVADVALVAVAQVLHDEYLDSIKQRDFDALLVDKENVPPAFQAIANFVQEHPLLQDKFWRYLQLFSDTVSTYG